MVVVWPEAELWLGFGRSHPGTCRLFFTDRRLVVARLVEVVDGWMFGFLMTQRNLRRRQEQNNQMSAAGLDELLAADRQNSQVPYQDVTEIKQGTTGLSSRRSLYIKTGRSNIRATPYGTKGILAYGSPDAVPDPNGLVIRTMGILSALPALSGKVSPNQVQSLS